MTPEKKAALQAGAAKSRARKAWLHEQRKSFKKWAEPGRTMTETKEWIEARRAKSHYTYRIGRNNTKGDPFRLSNPNTSKRTRKRMKGAK